jgi:hypothetical protein
MTVRYLLNHALCFEEEEEEEGGAEKSGRRGNKQVR